MVLIYLMFACVPGSNLLLAKESCPVIQCGQSTPVYRLAQVLGSTRTCGWDQGRTWNSSCPCSLLRNWKKKIGKRFTGGPLAVTFNITLLRIGDQPQEEDKSQYLDFSMQNPWIGEGGSQLCTDPTYQPQMAETGVDNKYPAILLIPTQFILKHSLVQWK
jgi:hypothetical protein